MLCKTSVLIVGKEYQEGNKKETAKKMRVFYGVTVSKSIFHPELSIVWTRGHIRWLRLTSLL